MRLLVAFVVSIAATAFVPLVAVLVPYAWSHIYIHRIPFKSSHPHVNEALTSLRTTCFAAGCLLPPLSFVPFLCQAKENLAEVESDSTLFRFAVDQGASYDSVILNTPSKDDFSLLSELHDAADTMLDYDGRLLLHQDGARKLSGVGDVRLLSNIERTSRVALYALYRVVLHVELSIARYVMLLTCAHGLF